LRIFSLLPRRFTEFQNEDLPVGMEAAAGGGFAFLHGVCGEHVSNFVDEPRGSKRLFDIVALKVDIGIDFVSDSIIALVSFEADVVSGGADPHRLAVNFEGRFPNTQVIARGDNRNRFGVGPAVILLAAEEVERAHGHGKVGFLGHAFEEAVKKRVGDIGVDFDPPRGREDFFHRGLRAYDQEVDHVAGVTGFIGNAAWDFGKEVTVDATDGSHRFGRVENGIRIGGVNLDTHRVRTIPRVAAKLIDADRQAAGDRRDEIAFGADEKWLRGGCLADAADDSPASGFIEGKSSEKILEATSDATRGGVGLLADVAQRSGGGGNDVLARLHIDAGVEPGGIPGQLNFLRYAKFSGRKGIGGRFAGRRLSRRLLGLARDNFGYWLGVQSRGHQSRQHADTKD